MQISLAPRITSTFSGYSQLIELYYEIKSCYDQNIELLLDKTYWFEANLAAVLGAIIELSESKCKTIKIANINNRKVKDILCRNGFLTEYFETSIIKNNSSVVPYRKFDPFSDVSFVQYIKDELLSKSNFPKHSSLLGKKINENIFELYENARTHGQCRQIHTCGQYYPEKKRLDFTIVDMGKTIKNNVSDYLKQSISGEKAIAWALEYGNTTKTGNISGGLGLGIIMEFIKLNQGKIQFVSSDGYWEYRRGEIITKEFSNVFPGTIANIEFNLDDKNSYSLKEEISLQDIF